jgi:hypothetical protein
MARVLPVHTLLCRRDVALAATCLASLARCSDEPIELIVHDDGTLDEGTIEPLRNALFQACPAGKLVFISRAAAEPVMRRALESYPACYRFRQTNVFGLKLFDIAELGNMRGETRSTTINYCDGDVYFFKQFRRLFNLPDGCDGIFLHDAQNMIAWRSWQVLARRAQFVSHLNAGMYCIRPELLDLSRLEWYFRHRSPPVLRHFVEQSAWALLAAHANGVRLWNARQIPLAHPGLVVSDETVAVHYVQTHRDLLERDVAAASTTQGSPAEVTTTSARMVGAWSIGVEEARRFLRRRRS